MSSVFIVYRPAPPGDPHETLQFVERDFVKALAFFLDAVENEEDAQLHWSA